MKNISKNNNRKENKMKKLTAIITISVLAIGTTLFAQSSTTQIGSSYFHSDGSSTTRIGSSYFNSKKERTPTYILDDNKKSKSKSLFDW